AGHERVLVLLGEVDQERGDPVPEEDHVAEQAQQVGQHAPVPVLGAEIALDGLHGAPLRGPDPAIPGRSDRGSYFPPIASTARRRSATLVEPFLATARSRSLRWASSPPFS